MISTSGTPPTGQLTGREPADHPIESALSLVDLLSESIHAHISELDICIPETEVDHADRIGEDAVEHFKADVERCREDLARLTKIEKLPAVKKKPILAAPDPPVVKSSTPLSVLVSPTHRASFLMHDCFF